MGKMEDALRDEIRRLARKEIKDTLTKFSRDIRTLKKENRDLRRQVDALTKQQGVAAPAPGPVELPPVSEAEMEKARFSAKLLKKLRTRLNLSQGELADLLGVSTPAVSAWEQGRARPAGENLKAIVALRKLGRREIQNLQTQATT
jgi:DNA-binding transcriptional regulator YiaG